MIVLGTIMTILDTTIVNVALKDLSTDLNTSLTGIQWVATGYLLSLAAVIPVTGWAATRFGTRRLYLISLVLFTAGSALCGLARSSEELIAFRVLQGVGGGMLAPLGQMILVRTAGPRNLPRVMGAIGVPMLLAPVFGPTIGGLLLEHAGWQWIFLVNLPVGIVAFFFASRMLPRDDGRGALAGNLDAVGLGLLSTGLVGITYGLAEIGTSGSVTSGKVLIPLLLGLVLVASFVWRALRIPNPLLNVRLYANKAFAAASLTTFCLGAALFGAMILMPLYFQTVRGEDAVHTGLLLIPQGIGAAIAMFFSGRATERFGGGLTALFGGIVTLLTTIPFVLIGGNTSFVLLGVAMVIRGFGIGMSFMPSMTAAWAVLRPEEINTGTPQLNVLQRVGGSIGTAILTVVLQNHLQDLGASPTRDAMAGAFSTAYVWVLGVTAVSLLPTFLLMVVERRTRRARAAAAGPTPEAPAPAPAEALAEAAA